MLAELERCRTYGTPRPESQAIRAHVPAAFWSFANTWRDVFHTGVADHGIKELCRLYVSRSVLCEFCGNQRSIKAAKAGDVVEEQTKDLINFEPRLATARSRRRRCPTPRRSPGICRSTTNSGHGCTGTSASPSWSRSAISSPSPWASNAGCARSTSSTTRSSPVRTARWRQASRPRRRSSAPRPRPTTGRRKSHRPRPPSRGAYPCGSKRKHLRASLPGLTRQSMMIVRNSISNVVLDCTASWMPGS